MIPGAVFPRNWPHLRIDANSLESIGIQLRESFKTDLLAHHRTILRLNVIDDQGATVIGRSPTASFAYQGREAVLLGNFSRRFVSSQSYISLAESQGGVRPVNPEQGSTLAGLHLPQQLHPAFQISRRVTARIFDHY
jgi:hypothetical protein